MDFSELYKSIAPAQVRTFAETLFGNRSPITEADFTEEELEQARQAVAESLWRQPSFATHGTSYTAIPSTANTVSDNTVGYSDYPRSLATYENDLNVLPEAAMRNTLGRFAYEPTPEGNVVATDKYDFENDLVGQGERPTAEYASMGGLGKLRALAQDTLFHKKGLKKGIATLPSRLGSAYVGADGRPVRVDLGPADKIKRRTQKKK